MDTQSPRTERTHQFTSVDDAGDPAHFVRFLDELRKTPGIARCRRLGVEALRLQPGDVVLDLGCGTGDAAGAIAAHVSPGGQVVGVDFSAKMVAVAERRRFTGGAPAGRELPVTFEVGDAQALRFADGTFNSCRTERMLVHVPDARSAVAEMVRVTRPGGRVVALDVDCGGMVLDHPDRAFTRTVLTTFTDSLQNGWIGRQLPRLFTDAGLAELTVEPLMVQARLAFVALLLDGHLAALVAAGTVTAERAADWRRDLSIAEELGRFCFAMPVFVVAGTKPIRAA